MGAIDWAQELVTSAVILVMGAAFYFMVTRTRIMPRIKVRKRLWLEKRKARWAFVSGHPRFSAMFLSLSFLGTVMVIEDMGRLGGIDAVAHVWIFTKYPFALVLGISQYLSLKHILVDEESGTPLPDSSEKT